MENFKKWIEGEFNLAIDSLKNIPPEKRKGNDVALLRKRARDTEITIKHVAEYESVLNKK